MSAAVNRRMLISNFFSTGRRELTFAALQRRCRRNNGFQIKPTTLVWVPN